MTRLAKSRAAQLVGPVVLPTRPEAARERVQPAPSVPLQDELSDARAQVAHLRDELAAARTAGIRAQAEARAAGRREGEADAADESERRLAAIGEGLAAAAAAWSQRLDALEPLAVLVARAVLLKLIATDERMDELVTRSIARQMELVRRDTVVSIRVSAADFPDDAALVGLSAATGTGDRVILADQALEPGSCRIELLLGEIELGVRTRWREAAQLLEAQACGGSTA